MAQYYQQLGWAGGMMGYPAATQASRPHPSSGHMVDHGQAVAAQFYPSGAGAMPQAPPHPGHSASHASSLARLTQMTHSLDLPGIPGVPPVPGHSMPQATPPPAAPASSSTSSSKSTAAAAPRQSKSKSRAPSSAAAAPPQAPPTPASHPALLPHAAYPYPPAPHHASTAAQARSGQPQIAPRPPAQAINNAVMQQYANAMQVQHGAMAYQQYAMLHQHNPALVRDCL